MSGSQLPFPIFDWRFTIGIDSTISIPLQTSGRAKAQRSKAEAAKESAHPTA